MPSLARPVLGPSRADAAAFKAIASPLKRCAPGFCACSLQRTSQYAYVRMLVVPYIWSFLNSLRFQLLNLPRTVSALSRVLTVFQFLSFFVFKTLAFNSGATDQLQRQFVRIGILVDNPPDTGIDNHLCAARTWLMGAI